MKPQKRINIQAVLNYISGIDIDNDTAIEYAAQALKELNITQQKVLRAEFIDLTNHKATLPVDVSTIVSVYYNESCNNDDYFKKTCTPTTNIEDIPQTNDQHLCRITAQKVRSEFTYGVYSDIYNQVVSGFVPLRLNPTKFSALLHIEGCENTMCTCDHYYNVDTNYDIISSLDKGQLLVFYLGKAIDEDTGDLLIPDDGEFIEGLAEYIMMKYWKTLYNASENGAENRYMNYKVSWSTWKRKLKGKYIIKEITLNDIRRITSMNNHVTNDGAIHNYNYTSVN